MKLTAEEKQQREIARLEKEKSRAKAPGYMGYFFLIISVIYLADEIVSQIGTQTQSILASQLFAPIVGEEFAVARMTAVAMIPTMLAMVNLLYRPLSDRYGRKIFLVINTIGMGVATIVIGAATNIPAYCVGIFLTQFFIPNDMQAVYLQECAPPEHRGKMFSSAKFIATMGMLLIPLLRKAFIPGNDMSNWRGIYYVPGIIAIVTGIISAFLIRESDAFVDTRLRQLKMTDEEKAAAKEKKQDVTSQGGLVKAFKFCFSHKQIVWLLIAGCLLKSGGNITSNYESIMTLGYAQQYLDAGMDLTAARAEAATLVTQALMLFSVGSAFAQLIPGFIADKFGRKASVTTMSILTVACYLVFYIGANNAMNPYIVGLFCGAAVGAFWATGDMAQLMVSESVPTNVRVSVNTIFPLLANLGRMLAMIVLMVVTNILGDSSIGLTTLISTIPLMVIGILSLTKVKDTKGVDMGAIRGDEFDN